MGSLLGQAHPHLVLLGLLDTDQRKIGQGKEQDQHSQLDIGEISQATQQCGDLVIEVLRRVLVDLNVDFVLAVLEMAQLLVEVLKVGRRNLKGQAILGLRQTEVAVQQDVVLIIDQQHGNVVVGLDDAQQEIHIGGAATHRIAIGIHVSAAAHRRQFLSRVGPDLHAPALLDGKILDQIVGHIQEQRHQHQRDGQKHHLPDAS